MHVQGDVPSENLQNFGSSPRLTPVWILQKFQVKRNLLLEPCMPNLKNTESNIRSMTKVLKEMNKYVAVMEKLGQLNMNIRSIFKRT